jgi:RNase P/RNase MRP subunit POP5
MKTVCFKGFFSSKMDNMASQNSQKNGAKKFHKTNPLKPTMREDKRYVAFEIMSEKPLAYDADRVLIAKINSLLGVFESAAAGILRVKYNQKNQRGLLRIGRKYVDKLRVCFVMIKELSNQKVLVRTLRVSGMLNKALPATGLEKTVKK